MNSSDLSEVQDGADTGINNKSRVGIDKNRSKFVYVVSGKGKHTKLSFINASTMGAASIGRYRCFLIFVDDYIRMIFVYFLTLTSYSNLKIIYSSILKEFKALVENQLNNK